jgi:Raf kinase inhibitor-like YbhB/YbcL family protein
LACQHKPERSIHPAIDRDSLRQGDFQGADLKRFRVKLQRIGKRSIAMTLKRWTSTLTASALLVLLTACSVQGEQLGAGVAALQVSSASFSSGGNMPQKLTCDGADVSPNIQWSTAPAGTQSYAIVMDDPDAPFGFTHWLAYNIPATAHELPEGASTPSTRIDHAAEGINSFGHAGYGGPCPPNAKPHHYVFHVYALDVNPNLPAGQGKDQVMDAIKGHVLAAGKITGLYGRSNM